MRKYEFTGEEMQLNDGRTLKRIRAVRDFGSVKAGDLGGWIEAEGNLSHDDECWVHDNAQVYGDAQVYGSSRVYGNADIFTPNHVVSIANIGSRNDTTTFFRTRNNDIYVVCGCFFGDLQTFLEKVNETHGNNRNGMVYRLASELARTQIGGE